MQKRYQQFGSINYYRKSVCFNLDILKNPALDSTNVW